MCLLKLCMEETSVRMVQHHSSQGMITIVVMLLICYLLIFVHELRAIQRNVHKQNHFQNDAIKSLLQSNQIQSNNHKRIYNNANA